MHELGFFFLWYNMFWGYFHGVFGSIPSPSQSQCCSPISAIYKILESIVHNCVSKFLFTGSLNYNIVMWCYVAHWPASLYVLLRETSHRSHSVVHFTENWNDLFFISGYTVSEDLILFWLIESLSVEWSTKETLWSS